MHWCKGKKLTRWGEFTDHQLQSGSECAKAGPDKLEPRVLMWVGAKTWERKEFFITLILRESCQSRMCLTIPIRL